MSLRVGDDENTSVEICTTDMQGRFITERLYPQGPMRVELEAPYCDSRRFRFKPAGKGRTSPLVLRFDVGPEVALEPRTPAGCDPASLLGWRLGPGEHPWFNAPPALRGAPLRAPSGEGPAHLRFPRRFIWDLEAMEPDRVFVGSEDGFWGGSVDAAAPYAGPHPVHLEALGKAQITLLPDRPLGDSKAADARVDLVFTPQPPARSAARPFTTMAWRPEVVGWLAPGRWHVAAESDYFEPSSTEITVHPLQTNAVEILLGRPVETGTISIVIEDRRGDHPGPGADQAMQALSGSVTKQDGSSPIHRLADRTGSCGTFSPELFRRSERAGGTFFELELHQVPAGEYQVDIRTGNRGYDPPVRMVQPGQTAEFILQPRGFEVRAFDAATGDPIHNVSITDVSTGKVFQPGHPGRLSASQTGLTYWRARAPGYATLTGSTHELVCNENGARLELPLQRGWGVTLYLEDGSFRMAPNVRVRLAGSEFVTSKRGEVRLTAPAAPTDCRLELVGYEFVTDEDGANIAADGSFSPDAAELWGVIRRVARDEDERPR